jgi:sterol desaturase/sphingolipid hydroxylase (fatty acid hydroxylase superfamily)
LVTTFLIVYIWLNGAVLYLLQDPAPFAWGILIGNCLDILRHSGMERWPNVFPLNWLISPREHAWHHSQDLYDVNFGANFNLWDKIHGTHYDASGLPRVIGGKLQTSLWEGFWKGSP